MSATAPAGDTARRPLVAGNWKMHLDHIEALHMVRDLGFRLEPADADVVEVSIHPPFTDLRTVQTVVEDRGIPVVPGAQHCSEHPKGAYTGEVSPAMLARLGVRYVLVGHSERRHLFGMSDATVCATLKGVVGHGMVPVLCVGETEEQRAGGETEELLRHQLAAALEGVEAPVVAGAVVAYEPVWAIGTGLAATSEDAQAACRQIREDLQERIGGEGASSVRILYGGSVNRDNAASLVAQPDVDGLLVGGASTDAAHFHDIVRSVAACYRSLVRARPSAQAEASSGVSGSDDPGTRSGTGEREPC